MHICMNCNHEVEPTIHGKCPDCGSEAVSPLNETFGAGSRESLILRETKRTVEIGNKLRKLKSFFTTK